MDQKCSKFPINENWRKFKDIIDLEKVEEAYLYPFRSDIPLEQFFAKECVYHYKLDPDALGFLLSGSRKELSWIARFFKEGHTGTFESDVLVYIKKQTLEVGDKAKLRPVAGRPGFVYLMFDNDDSINQWIKHFQIVNKAEHFSVEDYKIKSLFDNNETEQETANCISATKSRSFALKIEKACRPSWGGPFLNTISEAFSDVTLTNDHRVSEHGPAASANYGTLFQQFNHSLHRFLLTDDFTTSHYDALLQCFKFCLNCAKSTKTTIFRLLGSELDLDIQTGLINCNQVIDSASKVELHKQNIDLFTTLQKVFKTTEKLKGFYTNDPYTSYEFEKLSEQVHPPSVNDSSFSDQIQYFQTAAKLLFKIKKQVEFFTLYFEFLHSTEQFAKKAVSSESFMSNFSRENDFVFSVKCEFWPDEAMGWVHRKRLSGFPSVELCEAIAQAGVHIVPKSFKGGNEQVHWRYSFSQAENQLSERRSQVQQMAYLIIKAIFYENLQMEKEEGESTVSSYCLKTIMLWACETYDQDTFWKSENLEVCVYKLWDEFIYALKQKDLPHYFISNHNILQDISESRIIQTLQKAQKLRKGLSLYPRDKNLQKVLNNIEFASLKKRNFQQLQKLMRMKFAKDHGNYRDIVHQISNSSFLKTLVNESGKLVYNNDAYECDEEELDLTSFFGVSPQTSFSLSGQSKNQLFGASEVIVEEFIADFMEEINLDSSEGFGGESSSTSNCSLQRILPELFGYPREKLKGQTGDDLKDSLAIDLMHYLFTNGSHRLLFSLLAQVNNKLVMSVNAVFIDESHESRGNTKACEVSRIANEWNAKVKYVNSSILTDQENEEQNLERKEKICVYDKNMTTTPSSPTSCQVIANMLMNWERMMTPGKLSCEDIGLVAFLVKVENVYEENLSKRLEKLGQYFYSEIDLD